MRKKKRKYTRRAKPPVLPINIDPPIDSKGWSADSDMVASAKGLFATPTFNAIYSIMVNERPSKVPYLLNSGSQALGSAQAFSMGYEHALAKLLGFSHFGELPKDEPMTFAPEE